MNAKFLFALLLLFTGSAFAANQKPVVAHTFVCNGNPAQASVPCPNGAEPDFLIQGSDGNFYGTALYSSEIQVTEAQYFRSRLPASSPCCTHSWLEQVRPTQTVVRRFHSPKVPTAISTA